MRTRYKNRSGIYQLQSIINEKIYIGSSVKVLTRKTCHFKALKGNSHNNIKLQRHCNKYGINDLKWVLLEYCSKDKLIEREQYYLDTLKPEFNISPTAYSLLGIIRSERTKRRMCKNHADFKGENHPNYGKKYNIQNRITDHETYQKDYQKEYRKTHKKEMHEYYIKSLLKHC